MSGVDTDIFLALMPAKLDDEVFLRSMPGAEIILLMVLGGEDCTDRAAESPSRVGILVRLELRWPIAETSNEPFFSEGPVGNGLDINIGRLVLGSVCSTGDGGPAGCAEKGSFLVGS